jgi:hypothetical protein
MTKAEQKTIERFARAVADQIGLRDWVIDFDWDNPAGEGDGASVAWPEGRKHAVIRMGVNFMEQEAQEQRYIVVHELTHCHFAQMQDTVEEDLQEHLATPTYHLFGKSFRRAFEYGIDATAHAIAEHMPLIEWPS